MSTLNEFVAAFEDYFGRAPGIEKRKKLKEVEYHKGVKIPDDVFNRRYSHGYYNVTDTHEQPVNTSNEQVKNEIANTLQVNNDVSSFIPSKDNNFVRWGISSQIKKIIQSGLFMPTLVSGLMGNGKTELVIQACADTKRPVIRVNFTLETDEDDLIGGYRLINGDTVWQDGPVIQAMKHGAVLLLDEIDRASHKIMSIQSVLEGNSYYIKKTGELVEPKDGFTIIATANTKGKGSDDGRFAAANILDEALLDRFSLCIEQPYPTKKTEKNILKKALDYNLEKIGLEKTEQDETFVNNVIEWVETIRKTFADGGVDEVISTRRSVDIIKAYLTLGRKEEKAIELTISRFDEDTKESFLDLWKKLIPQEEEKVDDEDDTEEVDF